MALTATITKLSYSTIKSSLGMINPYEVIMSPNKENIHYSVIGRMSLQDLAEKLSDSLRKEKMKYPKTVIFCRRCVKCVRKYCLFVCVRVCVCVCVCVCVKF